MSLSVTDNHIILVLECYWQCQPYQPLVGNGDMLTRSYPLTIIMISVGLASISNSVSPAIVQFNSLGVERGGGMLNGGFILSVGDYSAEYLCGCLSA